MEHLLTHDGYAALILLAFVEACCIPIPSEVTFGFAGVLCASGKLSLPAVIVLGTAAEICGSLVAYVVGRTGGRPLVERLGRYVLLTRGDLDRAERWFSGGGEFAVALGRATPVLRAFVSLAAGIGEMPLVRFIVFGGIGTLAYAAALTGIGDAVGASWHHVAHDFSLAGIIIIVVVVIVAAAGFGHRVRTVRHERASSTRAT